VRSRFGPRQGPGPERSRPPRESNEPTGQAATETPAKPTPPRKPAKPRELPKLTQAKIEGRESLQTFSELAAFFKGRIAAENESSNEKETAEESDKSN
jgi:hypothetical protein